MADPDFASALLSARHDAGLSQRRAAVELKKMGVSVSERAIAGYEREENRPDPIKQDQILTALRTRAVNATGNVATDTALTGSGPKLAGLSAPAALVESLQARTTLTLYTDVCAGDGVLVFDEASRITVSLPPALAFHLFGFQPPTVMGVSQVVGDSMEPMLHDGDLVLYQLTPDLEGDGVHVLSYDGQAACKRVQRVGKSYRLIPENRAAGYEPELIRHTAGGFVHDATGDEIEFGIVGRVLFPRPETPRLHIQQVRSLLTQMFREEALGREG